MESPTDAQRAKRIGLVIESLALLLKFTLFIQSKNGSEFITRHIDKLWDAKIEIPRIEALLRAAIAHVKEMDNEYIYDIIGHDNSPAHDGVFQVINAWKQAEIQSYKDIPNIFKEIGEKLDSSCSFVQGPIDLLDMFVAFLEEHGSFELGPLVNYLEAKGVVVDYAALKNILDDGDITLEQLEELMQQKKEEINAACAQP